MPLTEASIPRGTQVVLRLLAVQQRHSAAMTDLCAPVRVGDSMHDISQRYGIRLDRLYKLNNKDADYAPEEGDVLRLR